MSTARRRLSGTSAHPTMVTQSISWSWMDDSYLFIPCQSAAPFLRYSNFRLWPWNSKVKVMGVVKGNVIQSAQYHDQPTSFSFHINQTNNSWETVISKFDFETSKVKVMSEVKGQGHILYPCSIEPMHFLFASHQSVQHSWDMAKMVFDLEKTHPKFLKKICQNNSF